MAERGFGLYTAIAQKQPLKTNNDIFLGGTA